jgi:PPOX class probable F420-dependent enzyme
MCSASERGARRRGAGWRGVVRLGVLRETGLMNATPPTPITLDPSLDIHARAIGRLETERIAWLTTIGANGFPHAVPVWFLWRSGRILILSEPKTAKVRNLRANDHALVHLEAGADGEQLTVLQGTAAISDRPATEWIDEIGAAYSAKYGAGLAGLELTAQSMAERYSCVIELTPVKLIAW